MEMNTTFLIVQNVEVRQTWKCRPRKLHQIVMQYVLFLKYCCENKKYNKYEPFTGLLFYEGWHHIKDELKCKN